jgi:hypothetical protein
VLAVDQRRMSPLLSARGRDTPSSVCGSSIVR